MRQGARGPTRLPAAQKEILTFLLPLPPRSLSLIPPASVSQDHSKAREARPASQVTATLPHLLTHWVEWTAATSPIPNEDSHFPVVSPSALTPRLSKERESRTEALTSHCKLTHVATYFRHTRRGRENSAPAEQKDT